LSTFSYSLNFFEFFLISSLLKIASFAFSISTLFLIGGKGTFALALVAAAFFESYKKNILEYSKGTYTFDL